MFDSLTERLSTTLRALGGKAKLTEDNIGDTLREVRRALLEADVALSVVQGFLDAVRTRALGMEVSSALSPGQAFLKIVHEELVRVMGAERAELNLAVKPPAIILLAGLQGAGKTTTAGKLAQYLKTREKKRVMMVSADVYRPAAIEQLAVLGTQVGVTVHPSQALSSPEAIVRDAVAAAKTQLADVLIVDTAGRLAVDDAMMAEIKTLHEALAPAETLFVVDAMTGQDAANTAKAFADALPLTGVVLSKADGDARGGAALSVRQITGRPIKFLGMGEKLEALEPFHPDRMASRILGMGDVLSLIEEAEQKLDRKKAERLATKIKKGKGFDLEDFRDQLQQMKSMGGMQGMLEKLPGMGQMAKAAEQSMDQKRFVHMEALICAMTPKERRFPDLISGSRKQRIARGSGLQVQDVNRLLKQHKQMQKMMKKMGQKGGMQKMMRGMGALMGGGGMPPMPPPGGLRRR
ncbi:MAG: signal recognition particle protein [Gammaproteobacteria bacterium]|jgi:signal recognition particle subunit SRP54|nr:signal recognition particle protein [Gammaproteobacteria bacterium]